MAQCGRQITPNAVLPPERDTGIFPGSVLSHFNITGGLYEAICSASPDWCSVCFPVIAFLREGILESGRCGLVPDGAAGQEWRHQWDPANDHRLLDRLQQSP